jgi:hypothetical protein
MPDTAMSFVHTSGLINISATKGEDMHPSAISGSQAAAQGRVLDEAECALRELDHRSSDGIEVWLLWDEQTERVCLAVEDHRLGDWLAFEVDGADALSAFHHPYAYAPSRYRSLNATPSRCRRT